MTLTDLARNLFAPEEEAGSDVEAVEVLRALVTRRHRDVDGHRQEDGHLHGDDGPGPAGAQRQTHNAITQQVT